MVSGVSTQPKALANYCRKCSFYFIGYYCNAILYQKHPRTNSGKSTIRRRIRAVSKSAELFNLSAWNAKGNIYYKSGKYTTASGCYTSAHDLLPDNIDFLMNRANAYRKQERYQDAYLDIEHALSIQAEDAELLNLKGLILLDLYERKKAIETFSLALEKDPEAGRIWHNRGNAYYWMLRDDEAISDYTKAIELQPDIALYYNNRGLVYFYQNKYSLALEDYNHAIKKDPECAAAYLNRSRLYKIFGNEVAAKNDVNTFKELQKNTNGNEQ